MLLKIEPKLISDDIKRANAREATRGNTVVDRFLSNPCDTSDEVTVQLKSGIELTVPKVAVVKLVD